MKKSRIFLFFPTVILLVFVLGPVPQVEDSLEPITGLEDPEIYLKTKESAFPELKPGNEKKITWYAEPGQKTEFSVVYVHGYSASRGEIAPVPELVAKNLKANFFATRLTGHGLPGKYMTEGNVHAWLNDGYEAIEIGRKIGNKVIVIGVSTGATILTALLVRPEFQEVYAAIFLSPNFFPRDKNSSFLTYPWGKIWVPLALGKERKLNLRTEESKLYWTEVYPTEALVDMMAMVKYTNSLPLANIKTPILFYYHENDQVISVPDIRSTMAKINPSLVKEIVVKEDTGDVKNHVITGSITAPEQVDNSVRNLTLFITDISKKP